MKKIFVLLLATAMIFALAACGATPNGTDNNNTQDDHQAETPDASYEAPQITELYNEDFDYTDGVGNSGHYTYRVPQLLADSEVVFTCLNKNVLLLGKEEFAQLGEGKVLFNTSIGPGFDSAALEDWLTLPGTHFFCDTRAAAGPVGEGFFERENVHCANVSAGRTKQAFVLLSQKVLANIRTVLGE